MAGPGGKRMAEQIKLGDTAPDFRLKDQKGNDVTLSGLRGKKVLLSFHPLAWTSVCARQMKMLERNFERFRKLGVVPLGLSVDSVPTKSAWARHMRVRRLRLLSDFWPHGDYARRLGLFIEEKGFSNRANVLLDEEGKVIWMKVYPIPELPDLKEVFAVLKEH
ncbi:MAG: redoxin domain-containing protein [Thermoplasmata archaeon]